MISQLSPIMTEKVKRILGLARARPATNSIINVEKLERRVALLENGGLEEYSVERESARNIVGSIFKGRVKNIEHGLEGHVRRHRLREKRLPAFLGRPPGRARQRHRGGRARRKAAAEKKRITAKDIPSIYPVGTRRASCR